MSRKSGDNVYQIKLHQISQISSKLFNLHCGLMLLMVPKLHTSPLTQQSIDINLPQSEYHVWNTAKTLWYMSKNRSICASIPSIKRSVSRWLREKQVIVSNTFTANLSLWFNSHNPLIPAISSCDICQKTTASLHLTCLSCPQASRPKTAA